MLQNQENGNVNLIDKSTLKYGLIDTKTGLPIQETRRDWVYSEYIEIDGTEDYTLNGLTRVRYSVTDIDKNVIAKNVFERLDAKDLIGGSYIRFTFPVVDVETISFKHI